MLWTVGKRRREGVSVGSKRKGGFGAQSGDGDEESHVADSVVSCFGSSVAIGVAQVPLGTRYKLEERDEFPQPDRSSPAASIQFEG